MSCFTGVVVLVGAVILTTVCPGTQELRAGMQLEYQNSVMPALIPSQ